MNCVSNFADAITEKWQGAALNPGKIVSKLSIRIRRSRDAESIE